MQVVFIGVHSQVLMVDFSSVCHALFAADKLESFLKQFPDMPNAFLIGGPADVFVTEIADLVRDDVVFVYPSWQLAALVVHKVKSLTCYLLLFQLLKLKVELALLHYLSQIKVLQGTHSQIRVHKVYLFALALQ